MEKESQQSPIIDSILPVGFRTLLKIYERPTSTSGGFLLPEQENGGMPVMAQIIVLGKKTFFQNLQMCLGLKPRYKVGQWVYFRKYSVDELRINVGEKELIMFVLEDAEIIGIVDMQ